MKIASMWSRPASTVIMSELGFVYFLESTVERKVLNVYVCVLANISTWQTG